MTKELWINLPVKDVAMSREFFTRIGFQINDHFPGDPNVMASFFVGTKSIVLMLVAEEMFRQFTNHPIADPKLGNEVLLSIDAESREEVDQLARTVAEAGGGVASPPGDGGGGMYGFNFTDLDGHRWNVLHMG